MWNKTSLSQRLGIRYPIIQAPMAGGASTPELVAAISHHGGLGSLGAGYLSATEMTVAIKKIRRLTDQPFSVNLFIPEHNGHPDHNHMRQACQAINTCARTFNDIAAPVSAPYLPNFDEQIHTLLDQRIPVMSFTFGTLSAELISAFHANNTTVIGTATTLAEAHELNALNVDAIVAQGSEAGGHRGSFLTIDEESLFAIDTLLSQLTQHIDIPIIAAGGIMNGQSIEAMINHRGASAVQLGTYFLASDESGIHSAYKERLLNQHTDTTTLTRAFSGKLARGINNEFIACMQSKQDAILNYPAHNKLTKALRQKAQQQGNTEFMSLWAGQSAHLARAGKAGDLLSQLIDEATQTELTQ